MAKKQMITKTEPIYLDLDCVSLRSLQEKVDVLIAKYGDSASIDYSYEYDEYQQSTRISYLREETDEEFEKRNVDEARSREAKKKEAKQLKKLRDAKDYEVYLELKARYEK